MQTKYIGGHFTCQSFRFLSNFYCMPTVKFKKMGGTALIRKFWFKFFCSRGSLFFNMMCSICITLNIHQNQPCSILNLKLK